MKVILFKEVDSHSSDRYDYSTLAAVDGWMEVTEDEFELLQAFCRLHREYYVVQTFAYDEINNILAEAKEIRAKEAEQKKFAQEADERRHREHMEYQRRIDLAKLDELRKKYPDA